MLRTVLPDDAKPLAERGRKLQWDAVMQAIATKTEDMLRAQQSAQADNDAVAEVAAINAAEPDGEVVADDDEEPTAQPLPEGAQPKRPGVLVMQLVEGRNLPVKNTNGFTDPFVVMRVGKHRTKSAVWSSVFFLFEYCAHVHLVGGEMRSRCIVLIPNTPYLPTSSSNDLTPSGEKADREPCLEDFLLPQSQESPAA